GAPWPPSLRAPFERGGARGRGGWTVFVGEQLPLQHEVTGRERIRMAERAQGDVVRGPGADAGQGGPAFDEVLQRARGAEVDPAVEQGACDRVDRACARLGHAEARQ